jgi:hypothetical protein
VRARVATLEKPNVWTTVGKNLRREEEVSREKREGEEKGASALGDGAGGGLGDDDDGEEVEAVVGESHLEGTEHADAVVLVLTSRIFLHPVHGDSTLSERETLASRGVVGKDCWRG